MNMRERGERERRERERGYHSVSVAVTRGKYDDLLVNNFVNQNYC